MNRRGIELASSLIVILIVSIIIFGLASTVTYKILCTSESKLDSYSEQSRQALEKRMASGASVVVADASKSAEQPSSICRSSNFLGADYLIGVRNDESASTEIIATCFDVQLETAPGAPLVPASPVDCTNNVQKSDTGTLRRGERDSIPVVVNLPNDAIPGRYVVTMELTNTIVGSTFNRKVNLYLTLQ